MRTTVMLDDWTLAKAQALTEITDTSRLIHEALTARIARDVWLDWVEAPPR